MKKIFLYALVFSLYALPVFAVENPGGIFPEIGGGTFQGLVLAIVQILLGLIGLISMLFIMLGGYQYVVSGANEELAEKGKKTLRNAIIGLVVTILSYVIVVAVMNTLY